MKKLLYLFIGCCAVCAVCCSCSAHRTMNVTGRTQIVTVDTTYIEHGGSLTIKTKQ